MKTPFYDLKALTDRFRPEYIEQLEGVLDTGYFIGGTAVQSFEEAFAEYLGVEAVVGVANGLDALRLSLQSLGIGDGDEVIVPGFTFAATWLAVVQAGATAVPVDVALESAAIDPHSLLAAITPRTRAVIPVHLYGIPADLGPANAVLHDRGIDVIHDAAQAHGARYHDRTRVGSRGRCAAFSFYPTKNLGALGDAGCVATNDHELAQVLRSLRSYGQGQSKYDHVLPGVNSRIDPVQAAFLQLHLGHLDSWNAERERIASVYLAALGDHGRLVVQAETGQSVWHHFVLRVQDRAGFQEYLSSCGVGTDIHYPYHFNSVPALEGHRPSAVVDLPNSTCLAESVVSLPIGPWMTPQQVDHVAHSLATTPATLFE